MYLIKLINSFFNVFKNVCMAVLGLRYYMWLSLVAVTGGYSLTAMHGFPIAVASLVAEHGL